MDLIRRAKALIPASLKRHLRREAALENALAPFLPEVVCIDVGASYYPHPAWRVFLASGRARWVAVEPNDLDVGVSFQRDTEGQRVRDPRDRIALWTALVELTGYEGIDLVVLDVDNPVLRADALTGVPLYEFKAGEYAEAQIAAVGERRDTAHLRRRNLELMAQ